ncbi:type 1 glutamine amidotransferase domain-containing protein [Corynebacterium ulceribovis]|uniref:type 1 glutamine amidotransferase domain-containing protein n=1 Tax=Corynebacterium ulceribovis TaxID=487732 RepID=UPI00036AD95C|nr:type 1 glutamine amidotransferase domain-containing protein [Corynebacterium ulceribovis]
MTSVLMALSAASHWTLSDGTKHPTGFWAEEFLVPYGIFRDAGYDITIATPGAVPPTVDDISLGPGGLVPPWTAKKYREELAHLAPVLDVPADLHNIKASEYDLIFFPGGHGPMEDLAVDPAVGELLNARLRSDKPLALLCHAPAVLLATVNKQGQSPFAGRKVTALSNREELLNSFAKKAPWLLEERLVQMGVDYSKGKIPLTPHVVQDCNLFTGQNPQSSKKLAETLVENLGR